MNRLQNPEMQLTKFIRAIFLLCVLAVPLAFA